ncbi:MAG: hypothetical protein WD029_04665 [Microthrixaceae bacterium]
MKPKPKKSAGGPSKTFGIWGFVAVFTLLALLGVGALLILGSPNSPTEPVVGDLTPNTSLATTSSSSSVPNPQGVVSNTIPGGGPPPPGVNQVLSSPDSLSFTYAIPSDFPVQQAQTAVAPVRTRVLPNEAAITAVISCAQSSQERLAQVSISETAQSVTLAAVVLVPPNAPACAAAEVPKEVTLPLAAPLGQRTVLVVPPGTKVPQLGSA